MSRAKILYIIRQAEFGGGETHIKYIFDSLDFDLFLPVLASLQSGYLSDYAESRGIKFYLLSKEKYSFLKNLIILIKIITKEKIKFIHAHGTKGAALVLLPALLTNKRLIYTVHGWSFHSELTKFQFFIRKLLERLICIYAYKVIFVSEADLKLGDFVSPKKRLLIKNGVDVSRFFPFRNKRFREENGFTDKDFVIGFFARFTHQKNPLFVLELIKSLIADKDKSRKKFKLLMIGDGELKHAIIEKIKEDNLEEYVKVLPPSFEIEKYLHIIDCYVLPSFWEGLPYGILEAMSCGVPVVASKSSKICEIAKCNSELDSFCEEIDIEAFKKRILQLANDSSLYIKISENARKTIEEKFNLEDSIIEIIKLYEKLKVTLK